MTVEEVKKRLAHKVWELFSYEGIPNNPEGNWKAAEGIIDRILNGIDILEDYRNFFNLDDYRFLEGKAYERANELREDARPEEVVD